MKILIVDDEPTIANYLAILLCQQGHRVLPLNDQAEALEHAAMLTFDLALVGIVMPGMSGLELGDRLRKLVPACKIVLMDTLSTVEKVRQLRNDLEYLACPFETPELLRKLECVEQQVNDLM
jgi:DNA-binding response OmpR family regulator